MSKKAALHFEASDVLGDGKILLGLSMTDGLVIQFDEPSPIDNGEHYRIVIPKEQAEAMTRWLLENYGAARG